MTNTESHFGLVSLVLVSGLFVMFSSAVAQEDALSRARTAHGLESAPIPALEFVWDVTNIWSFQSRRPGPPWDRSREFWKQVIDTAGYLLDQSTGSGAGYEWDRATILSPGAAYFADYRRGIYRSLGELPFMEAAAEAIRYQPPLLLAYLRRSDADPTMLVLPDGSAATIAIDPRTGLVRSLQVDQVGWGPVEYRYLGVRRVSGLALADSVEVYGRGEPSYVTSLREARAVSDVAAIVDLDPDLIHVPEPDSLRRPAVKRLAEGAYLVGGGYAYSLFVDLGDSVLVAGTMAGLGERIDLFGRERSDPVSAVVVSHHHDDHLSGLEDLTGTSVTIVVPDMAAPLVRDVVPDARLRSVTPGERLRFGEHARVIDLGPSPHSEAMLGIWIEQSAILWTADLFVDRPTGPAEPATPNIEALHAALQRLGLEPDIFVDAHTPAIAPASRLRESLSRAR